MLARLATIINLTAILASLTATTSFASYVDWVPSGPASYTISSTDTSMPAQASFSLARLTKRTDFTYPHAPVINLVISTQPFSDIDAHKEFHYWNLISHQFQLVEGDGDSLNDIRWSDTTFNSTDNSNFSGTYYI